MEQITFLTLTAAVQNHYLSSPQQSSMSLQDYFSSIPLHKLLLCTRTLKEFLFKQSVVVLSLLPIGQKMPGLYQERTSSTWDIPWHRTGLSLRAVSQNSGSAAAGLRFLTSTDVISPGAAPFPAVQANKGCRGLCQGAALWWVPKMLQPL